LFENCPQRAGRFGPVHPLNHTRIFELKSALSTEV
jgi:hypothetical protein